MTITLVITREDQEVEALVELELHRASQGNRDRFGCPMEPDEPAEFEVVKSSIPLTREEEEEAIDKSWDEVNSECLF